MKRRTLALLAAVYGAAVVGIGASQYRTYRHSFEPLVPYRHSSLKSADVETAQELTEPVTTVQTAAVTQTVPETASQVESTAPETETEPPTTAVTLPINLNTADFVQLCALPEIGEVTAQAILDYRVQIGGFVNRAQLLEVPGIGEKRYEAIVSMVYLPDEQPLPTEPETVVPDTVPPEPAETDPPEIPMINLNTADIPTLMLLPGCTQEIAEKILRLRDEQTHGFDNPLELLILDEVTDELYASWMEHLAVDDEGGTQLYWDWQVEESENSPH